jgi:signal transduction histidine kinase
LRERISDELFPIASISRNGRFRLFVAFPVFYNDDVIGVVYLSRTPLGEMKDFLSKIDRIFVALLFIFGVIVVISLLLSNWLASPLKQLINKIDKFKNSPSEPITKESFLINEYDELFSAFSNLSESILERTEYIKNFAYHVSHEFKSPITAINGAIEILHDHLDSMPKEKALHFIDNISQDTARLHALTMQLLELAKADSIIKSKGECTVQELISSLGCHDNIEYQGEAKGYPISLEDLETVLNNLIDNGFQHGATKVVINFMSTSTILVEDNGTGISKDNIDKIFVPFFTTRRDSGGTGLGLQIVIATLKQYGASLNLKSTELNEGTTFEISFG